MKTSKKMLVAGMAALGISMLGAGVSYAAQPSVGTPTHMSGLVNALAAKFNLSPSEVQSVFDQQRVQWQADRQAEHAANLKTRLDQAVKDGKLTQAQVDLLTAKHAEMKVFMDSLKDKTPAERQAAMKTKMDALKTWMVENKIPPQFGMPFGGRMHGGMKGSMGKGGLAGFGKGMPGGHNMK